MLNYVALLGWSPRGELAEQEVFSLQELIQAFDISGISKSPAIFDLAKLEHFNALICAPWIRSGSTPSLRPISAKALKTPPSTQRWSHLCCKPAWKP